MKYIILLTLLIQGCAVVPYHSRYSYRYMHYNPYLVDHYVPPTLHCGEQRHWDGFGWHITYICMQPDGTWREVQ